jgi:hypothetical protein
MPGLYGQEESFPARNTQWVRSEIKGQKLKGKIKESARSG